MDSLDKLYTPEIIQESPFPNEVVQSITPTQGTGDNYTPTTTKEKSMPVKRSAVELLSTTLNTRSRKVLQEFTLQQSGGFQIGNFEEGISGDLRLTPNGLVARNLSGIETVAVDGTTGDAVFAGEIRSGSTVTGSVNIEDGGYLLIGTSIFIGDISSV